MAHTILVAVQDVEERSRFADVLNEVGYHVIVAATFKAARRLLASVSPNVLVAEIRMGVYNGLQLLATGRIDNPRLTGVMIATAPNDAVEAEAEQLGASAVLTRPVELLALLDAVARAIATLDARRGTRRAVSPGLTCEVEGQPGWIIDASEEGLRVELPHPVRGSLPASLQVSVPTLELTLPARMAWVAPPLPSVFRCGLELASADVPAALSWRRLVQALPQR